MNINNRNMVNKNSRREFLKQTVGIAALGLLPKPLSSEELHVLSDDRYGVLVDTTVCIGCRNCEYACKSAHGLETEHVDNYQDRSVFKQFRRPNENSLTVVNEFENPKNECLPIDVKVQCMHCDEPSCVSACIVGALKKNENGAVTWDTDKCIGCRYCMVACPFQIPTFEYDKALEPKITKCDFCYDRTSVGKMPACVEICPVEALTFAPRNEIIKLAREKIKRNPGRYNSQIYGETEVGGTSWLYLAGKDFKEIGLPELSKQPPPGTSESIQHGIFAYFVPPALYLSLLGMIMWITKKGKKAEGEENES